MRKINKLGMELIDFYEELSKNYPKLVKDSLISSLQQKVENDVIDMGTFELLKNEKLTKENLVNSLLENKRYVKSKEELTKEYEAIRKELDEDLKMSNLSHFFTESKIEDDEIYVCKTFTVDKNFVIKYFGVKEEDIPKLMSRKGFVEKFVALRLVKVLKDIILEGNRVVKKIKLGHSLAYIDESGEKYNIDLVMKVNIFDLDKIDNKAKIIPDIKEIEAISEKIYKQKMNY
jgi:hypothetical protein